MKRLTPVRLLISSPSDVQQERQIVDEVVTRLNRNQGSEEGYVLQPYFWETQAVPGVGPPQQLLNDQIGEYEIYLGLFWVRFGTPTLKWGSGTEEEFEIAYARFIAHGRPRIMFYFKGADFPISVLSASIEEAEQFVKVVRFRSKIQKIALFGTFRTTEEFSSRLYHDLYTVLADHLALLNTTPLSNADAWRR